MIFLQSPPPTNEMAQIILAIGSLLGIVGGIVSPLLLLYFNKKMNAVATSIDGLLEQKTLADKAIGRMEAVDTAFKEKAIGDARELESLKTQKLKDELPASKVKDVQDDIVKSLENEIHKKGDEIQKVVENKGDEIHKGVDEVPDKTAEKVVEKVVEKLPPTK